MHASSRDAGRGRVALADPVIVVPGEPDPRIDRAAAILIEALAARTRLTRHTPAPAAPPSRPVIVVGTAAAIESANPRWRERLRALPQPGPEGYRLVTVADQRPTVLVAGADARGVLYGVGGLLRRVGFTNDAVTLDQDLAVSTTPASPLRGHQLGYRPLNNTYDAWTVARFERYIRDLALFGANTIEFVPPGADDIAPTAPHMPVDPYEMLTACSRLCDAFGLDVSLWYPNEGEDYNDPACAERELAERERIFASMPRLDILFIPGGDPGGLDPDTLFAWSERVAAVLRAHHPSAGVCLSCQGFHITDAWLDGFHGHLRREPDWLDTVAFAPWEREPLPVLRERVPARYPIRRYPDIAHCTLCQYPVPRWDLAFAMTESREPINPRPAAQKHIHNLYREYAVGSVTYSEGVNDDVNKFVWADQEWDPATPVADTLRDYAHVFISPEMADDVARGLMALEENWRGPLAENEGVEKTLAQWLDLDARADETVRNNWRFEMPLLRACYDASLRRRLLNETALEAEAMVAIRGASPSQVLPALDRAEAILQRAAAEPVAADLKRRCDDLADRLWEHIGLQLTTTRHHGQRTVRGAFMDSIDLPLNDRDWLLDQFARIRALDDDDRAAAVREIVDRTDPGPGGRYEDFRFCGDWASVDAGEGWERDPAFCATPLIEYCRGARPLAHWAAVTTRYGQPLTIRYTDLDPGAPYRLRVTYQPGPWGAGARLIANDGHLVHDVFDVGKTCRTETFEIPSEVISDGALTLRWTPADPGAQGARIAELRLRRARQDSPS